MMNSQNLSVGFYAENPIPKINTFTVGDVSFGSRPVRITDIESVCGKPSKN